MYGTTARFQLARSLKGHHDPALFHIHGVDRTLSVHQRHVSRWFKGLADDPGKWLLGRVGSDRTMRVAYDYLRERGGLAPGPDGMSFADYECDGLDWPLCRGLAADVRDGHYQPGPLRRLQLSKGPGRGHRTLGIPNIEDRVVGRSAVEVLQPIFDPVFQPFSFGWRPGLSRLHALASSMAYANAADSWHWAVDDVANAFDAIPRGRMLAACRQLLPDDMVDFIGVLASAGQQGKRGLAQGGPVSPLLANIHFDAHLDAAWYRRHPGVPLLRTADDLMICASNETQANMLHEQLGEIARSTAGTPLKGGDESGVHDVRSGEGVDWLGFRIQMVDGDLTVTIGQRAWWNLRDQLTACSKSIDVAVHQQATILGWIDQAGPAYRHEPHEVFSARLRDVVDESGAVLTLTDDDVIRRLRSAHARYRKIEKRASRMLRHRRWLIQDWKERRMWPSGSAEA